MRWSVALTGPAAMVVAPDQTIYAAVGTGDQATLVHLAATGAPAWSRREGPTPTDADLRSFAPYTDLVGVPDGTIYVAPSSDARSLDRGGNDRWRRDDRHATALAMLPSGHLAIGDVTGEASGGVELVDPATGHAAADASGDDPIVPLGFPGLPDRLAATARGDLLVADSYTVSAWSEAGDAR